MRFLIIIFLLTISLQSLTQGEYIDHTKVDNDIICQFDLELKLDSNQNLYGFVDENGKYIIEAQFRCATEFIDCLSLVSKRDKNCDPNDKKAKDWFYINKGNISVMPPRVENRTKWESTISAVPNIK